MSCPVQRTDFRRERRACQVCATLKLSISCRAFRDEELITVVNSLYTFNMTVSTTALNGAIQHQRYLISAPGKVIMFGEHAVVHQKVIWIHDLGKSTITT